MHLTKRLDIHLTHTMLASTEYLAKERISAVMIARLNPKQNVVSATNVMTSANIFDCGPSSLYQKVAIKLNYEPIRRIIPNGGGVESPVTKKIEQDSTSVYHTKIYVPNIAFSVGC